ETKQPNVPDVPAIEDVMERFNQFSYRRSRAPSKLAPGRYQPIIDLWRKEIDLPIPAHVMPVDKINEQAIAFVPGSDVDVNFGILSRLMEYDVRTKGRFTDKNDRVYQRGGLDGRA